MKKLTTLLIVLAACLCMQAQNLLTYRGDTVDIEQLTGELDGISHIIDTATKYKGVTGGKWAVLDVLDATNDNITRSRDEQTDNVQTAIKLLLVDDAALENEYFTRLYIQYLTDNSMYDASTFIGSKVKALCVTGGGSKWLTGEYLGNLQGRAIIKEYKGVCRQCEIKTILPVQ
jgi:hypothetical protein